MFDVTVREVGMPFGNVWAARGPGPDAPIVGGIVVLRPDRVVPPGVWERMGAAEMDLLGDRQVMASEAEAACAVLRPAEPHLTVATMAVHPEHRRRGVASALLQPVLALADELESCIHLETSTKSNVALYRRADFTVAGRVDIPNGGPSVWGMPREVGGSAVEMSPGWPCLTTSGKTAPRERCSRPSHQ